jgi:hypothetical protein
MINSAKTGEGSLSADRDPSSGADFVRATFSHKGRREEGRNSKTHFPGGSKIFTG